MTASSAAGDEGGGGPSAFESLSSLEGRMGAQAVTMCGGYLWSNSSHPLFSLHAGSPRPCRYPGRVL